MDIVSKSSRFFLVNLFSDFILNKIPKQENTIIEVVDCDNFYVIKGKTTYTDILDLNKIKDEFLEKFPELKNEKKLLNTIDVIDYGLKIPNVKKIRKFFYNSDNCSFHQTQLEFFEKDSTKNYTFDCSTTEKSEELVIKSVFPFGYSMRMGRLLYYLAKHLVYNIPTNFPFEKIIVIIPENDFENELKFEDEYGNELKGLKSLFLDCFDFNLVQFENEIKKLDLSQELTNPTQEFEILKSKIKDIILF